MIHILLFIFHVTVFVATLATDLKILIDTFKLVALQQKQ